MQHTTRNWGNFTIDMRTEIGKLLGKLSLGIHIDHLAVRVVQALVVVYRNSGGITKTFVSFPSTTARLSHALAASPLDVVLDVAPVIQGSSTVRADLLLGAGESGKCRC